MKLPLFLALALLLGFAGCGAQTSTLPEVHSRLASGVRTYTGSAASGDFYLFAVHPEGQTINYTDVSSPESGLLSYVVDSDGDYEISDPHQNFSFGSEIVNELFVLDADKSGVGRATPALVVAVPTTTIALSQIAGTSLNYFHLSVTQNGFEIGSLKLDAHGNLTESSYSPYAAIYLSAPFHSDTFKALAVQSGALNEYLVMRDSSGNTNYIFRSADGYLVDKPNGTYIAFDKAKTKEFDPSFAGTYRVYLYEDWGVGRAHQRPATSSPCFGIGTLVVNTAGQITLTDSMGNVLASGQLEAVADNPSLLNGGSQSLGDPCYGIFTIDWSDASSAEARFSRVEPMITAVQKQFFLGFHGNSVVLAGFEAPAPANPESLHNFFYGVGEL